MQMKPIHVNSPSVDYTVSSTSTRYQMPPFSGSIRVLNTSGGVVYIEAGGDDVAIPTITVGTAYNASKINDGSVEMFTVTVPVQTHIAIYAPTATGTLTIQYGDGV
jgi:hypothetical protein